MSDSERELHLHLLDECEKWRKEFIAAVEDGEMFRKDRDNLRYTLACLRADIVGNAHGQQWHSDWIDMIDRALAESQS